MNEGQWIGRSPHGPVVSFPMATTEEEAKATAQGAYGPDHDLSIEWSDHPDDEVLLCDFCSDPSVVAEIHTVGSMSRTSERPEGTTLHTMDPVWAADAECLDLFVANDLDALALKSAEVFVSKRFPKVSHSHHKQMVNLMRQEILELHREVRDKWDGRPVPLARKGGE